MRATPLRLLVLLPAVIVTLFWLRSFSFRDSIYFSTPNWGGVFNSSAGALVHGGAVWTSPQAWSVHKETIPPPEMDGLDPLFRFHVNDGAESWYFSLPYWLIVLLLGLPALLYLTFADRRLVRQISPSTPNPTLEPTPLALTVSGCAHFRSGSAFGR